MSTVVTTETRRYTPEDLLAMPDEKHHELVDGRLVERNMGAESGEVGGNLFLRLARSAMKARGRRPPGPGTGPGDPGPTGPPTAAGRAGQADRAERGREPLSALGS